MRRGRYASPATLNLGLSAWRCASRNGNGVALSRRRYRSRTISGIAANNTTINNKQGDTKNTKSRGDSCRLRLGVPVGDARRKTGFLPHRPHHPHRHARHDDSSHDGKKKRPLVVQKVRRWRYKNSSLSPTLPTLPRGGSSLKAPPLPSPRGGNSLLLRLWRL